MDANLMYVEVGTVGNSVDKICLNADVPITVGELLENREITPAENGIYLNKRLVKEDVLLKDGDKIAVVPQVTGG